MAEGVFRCTLLKSTCLPDLKYKTAPTIAGIKGSQVGWSSGYALMSFRHKKGVRGWEGD